VAHDGTASTAGLPQPTDKDKPAAAATSNEDNDDDNEISDTPPPQRLTRSKMRRALPPNPLVVATESTMQTRLTRSKMARKPDVMQTASMPASVTSDDSTPTPSTDGIEPVTPPTVKVKGCKFIEDKD